MEHGIIFVKKEVGMSSYDVIRVLKKTFNTNKIGHAGSLDPFASGLLIIGINEGTKALPYIEEEYKEYIAELELGTLTDTYDITGKVIKRNKPKKHSKEEIREVLNSFLGDITQTPPIYSAIKFRGKPLYQYARENKIINVKTRIQHIYDIRLIATYNHKINFYVKCNKGTYIRSLGVDIASKLKEYGTLSNLERIGIGKNKILNVKKVHLINKSHIKNIVDVLDMKKVEVKDSSLIKNGNPIKLKIQDDLVLITKKNKALAIYEYNKNDKLYHCKRGFHYADI